MVMPSRSSEGIAFHNDTILERPWFRLVGIADDVMGLAKRALVKESLPFLAGREGGATPAEKPGLNHFANHALGSQFDCPA